jgi:hypothetical protein
MFGKSPHVELIKPKELLKKALSNRKGKCFVGEYLSFEPAERAGVEGG